MSCVRKSKTKLSELSASFAGVCCVCFLISQVSGDKDSFPRHLLFENPERWKQLNEGVLERSILDKAEGSGCPKLVLNISVISSNLQETPAR